MRKNIFQGLGLAMGLLLLAALAGGRATGAAETPKVEDLVKELQKRYESVDSMEAEFEQISKMANVEKSFRGKGKVYFQKPGKMRWEYDAPAKQLMVSDGEKIWFYQPKDKQAVVDKITRAFSGKAPVNFLMGIGQIREDFKLALSAYKGEKEGNYFELEMIPKEQMADVKKIVLRVGLSNYLVESIRVYDFFLNRNEINLKKIKTNKSFSKKTFTFSPPRGVKVIEPPALPAPAGK